jgi:hypothetical protein
MTSSPDGIRHSTGSAAMVPANTITAPLYAYVTRADESAAKSGENSVSSSRKSTQRCANVRGCPLTCRSPSTRWSRAGSSSFEVDQQLG